MKPSTTFALSTLVAVVAAIPMEKRNVYTKTVIDEVTETVDVVTTVWVHPGDPRLLQQQAEQTHSASKNQPAAAPVQTTTQAPPAPAYITPQKNNSPAPSPAPVQQQPQPQPQAKEVVNPAPLSQPAAPVVQSPSQTLPVAAPTAAPAAPAQSPAQSSSSSLANQPALSGGSCGQTGGQCVASDVTTYGGDGAIGSCGYEDNGPFGEMYFALAYGMMGAASNDGGVSSNPNCNRTAAITYNGQTQTGTLVDKCMGCAGASLDLSPALFAALFDGATTGRYHNIAWEFTS